MSEEGAHPADAIDWARPWLQDWRQIGEATAAVWRSGAALHQALNQQSGAAPRFVPQDELPVGSAYEQHIFDTGNCPTRNNLHDFFNGLCWLQFPLTKRRLNALQAAQIQRDGVQPVRGPVRDALTVFDENAAFLQAPALLWAALETRDWQALFVDLRPLWVQSHLVLFGHALLEKLVTPRKSITAHVYHFPVPSAAGPAMDACIAGSLSAQGLAAKPFLPLPILGVPGWWLDNEKSGYYADSKVFRDRRAAPG
jgi:hypothetical protein